MAVDERRRRQLHDRLDDVLGEDVADTLMEELGSLGREQLATRHDMELGFARLREDMAALRGDLQTGLARLGGELRAELHQTIAAQTRQLGMWMLGTILTMSALVLAAITL